MKKVLSVLIAILIVCSVAIAAPLADTSVMRYKKHIAISCTYFKRGWGLRLHWEG